MSRQRYTPEQIIGNLREAEIATAKDGTVSDACRLAGTRRVPANGLLLIR